MHLDPDSFLFLDTNVFIEHLFAPTSAASHVFDNAAKNIFKLGTSEFVIKEAESAILHKVQQIPESLNPIIERWKDALLEPNLTIFPDPTEQIIEETSRLYLASMRHKSDIPVLAAAISVKPTLILSNNRAHFNDIVAQRCKIPIYSCSEFIKCLKAATKS